MRHRARSSGILVLALLLVLPQAADAFWQARTPCQMNRADPKFEWGFSDDSEWERGDSRPFTWQVGDAFLEWSRGVARPEAGPVLTRGGAGYTMRWGVFVQADGDLDLNAYAQTTCGPPGGSIVRDMTFSRARSAEYILGQISFAAIATHEIGHAIGLNHSGQYDNADGGADVPTMTTCYNSSPTDGRRSISKDDVANFLYWFAQSQGFATATANPFFEQGITQAGGVTTHWNRAPNTILTSPTTHGGVPATGHYGVLNGVNDTTAGAMYQATTYAEGWLGNNFRFSADLKKATSTDAGYVQVWGEIRRIDYGDRDDEQCEYPRPYDGTYSELNKRTYPETGWQHLPTTCYPSDIWTRCTTSAASISSLYHPDALEFEVNVLERMRSGDQTQNVPVHVDVVRTEVEH